MRTAKARRYWTCEAVLLPRDKRNRSKFTLRETRFEPTLKDASQAVRKAIEYMFPDWVLTSLLIRPKEARVSRDTNQGE